jgi:hypothetical protein
MSDFNEWYAKINPNLNSWDDDFFEEVRKAYEAGAASQAGTLRDEFAMAALGNPEICTGHERLAILLDWFGSRGVNKYEIVSRQSLEFADAMLEARKTTGEGEA